MMQAGNLVRLVMLALFLLPLSSCSSTSVPARSSATQVPVEIATTRPPTQATARPNVTQQAAAFDLRYANVIDVDVEALGDHEFRFAVTLQHDDDGEAPNFADAWQVEDLEGNLLGTRELLHSHGNEPFTRSATITVPEGIGEVIVRGHDMTHGYGGQAMRVDLQAGTTTPLPGTMDQ